MVSHEPSRSGMSFSVVGARRFTVTVGGLARNAEDIFRSKLLALKKSTERPVVPSSVGNFSPTVAHEVTSAATISTQQKSLMVQAAKGTSPRYGKQTQA